MKNDITLKKNMCINIYSSLCIAVVTGLTLFMTLFAKPEKVSGLEIFIKHNY